MLHDFKELMPDPTIAGIDISEYAIANAIEMAKPFLRVGDAKERSNIRRISESAEETAKLTERRTS